MRSQDWFVPACRTFFVLASLPLYVSAQVDSFNYTTPRTTTDDATSTTVLIPPSTIIATPVDTFTQTSTTDSIPDTSNPVNTPVDTPVDTPAQDPTTTSSIIISESSTSVLIPNTPTTVNTPVGTPIDSTTELPVDTTSTTELPVDTTSTTELPLDTTSTTELPVDTPSTTEQPDSTTATGSGSTTAATSTTTAEDPTATITDAPISTVTGAAATSSVSSVSTEIIGLIPIINSWKEDPENLKDDTKNKVDDIENDVIGVIKDLGGNPDKGCDGKRKRGLLGAIGDVINSLVCIAQDLTDISGSIDIGDVTAVTDTLESVQSKTEELTDDDNDDNSSEKESTEQESTEQESTTTASCTQDTADHVTIICKPTQITQDGTVTTTETCYSSITAEVTGCSVTEATTVISTTGTAAITPCASDTCGGSDACPMDQLPLSGAEMNLVSTKVDCGAISTITTSELPTGYGTLSDVPVTEPTPNSDSGSSDKKRNELSAREFPDNTSPNPLYVATLNPIWVSQLGSASGHWFNYPDAGQGFVGVNGIYGCTAVIIASEKGVYLSHIWENPVFIDSQWNPTSDESFNSNAFEALRDGTQYAQSVTALIGDETNPGVLNAIYSPKVFVLTPFTGPNDPTGVTTTLRYQDRAQKLANDLAGVIPGSGGSGYLLGYTRYNEELSTMEPGWLGRAIFEVDMLQSVLMSPHAPEGSLGLRVGRWRLWVEDNLITYQDFWIPDSAPQNNQKRQDSDVDACLVVGSGSVTTDEATSTIPDSTPTGTGTTDSLQTPIATTETTETTEATETTETTQSTEPNETPQTQTPTQTTETTETTQPTETSEISQTPQTPTETPTKPPTTLQTSIITTSVPTTTSEEQTSTTDTFTGPVLCVNHGGPDVATPYCQCSTTTAGQTFFATAALISGYCTDYTTFPSEVTLQPTDVVTEAPVPTPWVTTEDNGAILSYTDLTVMYGHVYGTVEVTMTVGEGVPVTIRPADATQTDDNNKGSSECHSIDDACDRAVAEFVDDVIYTEFASYYTRIKSGIIVVASFGQAGCVVEYDCSDWSQGGMNGQQIKDAYQYMKDNDGVTKCGTTYLSNTCHVTSNYCTSCHEKHQDIN